MRLSVGDHAYSINTETESKAEGAQRVARTHPAWILKKGGEDCIIAERIRLSPAPWLGGWVGKQLRFLSVSRGQSILTDVQPGSLALNRRVTGLPLMQRMWFSRHGHSLGYMKPRGSADLAELFFFDSEARLSSKQQLPAAVADASDGTEQWFVACRNGRVYGFSLDGVPLWNELVPNARRDQSTNGLPLFHHRLHLAADGPALAIGGEQECHYYAPSGQRLWTNTLPPPPRLGRITITDIPTREDRLSRLGLPRTTPEDRVRTGYVRLRLDTLLNAGLMKQIQVDDIEDAEAEVRPQADATVEIGFPGFAPGISVIRASRNVIMAGTQDGLLHVFDGHGSLKRTFQVGETAVCDLLITPRGPKAASSAGRLTLFDAGRISASIEMPDYFAELGDCGSDVLAWQAKSVWLVKSSGRVQLVAETDRPIRGVWGHSGGFYVLAGELSSFQVRPRPTL